MKVKYVSLTLDPSLGFGVDRYSYDLYRELGRMGADVVPLTARDPFSFRGKAKFEQFVSLPLRALLGKADCDLFHFTSPLCGSWLPLIKRRHGKKIVTTIYDLTPILRPSSEKLSFMIKRALRSAALHSDAVIAISSLTKKDITDGFGVEPSKIVVTPLGTDPKFRPQEKMANRLFTVGYIGRFDGYKDVPFLIRAYSIFEKEHPGVSKLVLYGKGARYRECMELASSLGIRSAEFRGFAPENDIASIYNSFDLFAFPSDLEGFGLPVMEAQKCHVPVVVKSGAHIPEEVTRFCLKADDEEGMAAIMEEVRVKGFAFSQEHLRHLGGFTTEICAEKTMEAYKKALGE
jgi:glycosyltransferase involved in cell wall biosynthesis